MSFQVDSIVASVMEEDAEEPQTTSKNVASPAPETENSNAPEAAEDYSDIWQEEGSRASDSPEPASTEESSQEPDLFIEGAASRPGRGRFQRRTARRRDDEPRVQQRTSSSSTTEPTSDGKGNAVEEANLDDSTASDDTGMFFQPNAPAYEKKRRDRRQPKTDKLDLSLLLNEGDSLQPEPSPEKQAAPAQPNPFLDTPPRLGVFPSSPTKGSPLRRELHDSDITTPSRHDESTLSAAQSSPFHTRVEGDSIMSTASDQRQLLAEMEGVDTTSNSIRVLRAEADDYLDAYSHQERSLNEIEEVTEYSRTLQGDSSIMPSSPPVARHTFTQQPASSYTPSSVAKHPPSENPSEPTPTPFTRDALLSSPASSFISTSSAGRSDSQRAAAQIQREATHTPPRRHPILSKLPALPRLEPWTKTHYKALDAIHSAHLKHPTLFSALATPATPLSHTNTALLSSFAAATRKNYIGARVSAWGYAFIITPELLALCEAFMQLLTLNGLEEYEHRTGQAIERGDVAPGREGDRIAREEVVRRLGTVVLGVLVRRDEKKGLHVEKRGMLKIVGVSGEVL
ncbi:hypothetical protein OPT61_g10343 [Boeremia exigua]|uniref:Uncharacterized protein n=1 Tax=Boeremia exigua TaxID=749465 RepID=A0ACC2HQ43_9PLEO|nr:hypothetical protein OPT61_g10343 [Boeremia exigua]